MPVKNSEHQFPGIRTNQATILSHSNLNLREFTITLQGTILHECHEFLKKELRVCDHSNYTKNRIPKHFACSNLTVTKAEAVILRANAQFRTFFPASQLHTEFSVFSLHSSVFEQQL